MNSRVREVLGNCLNDQFTHALPRESKYKIYISCLTTLNIDDHNRIPSTDARLLRRIERDARTRGYSAQATIKMWPCTPGRPF